MSLPLCPRLDSGAESWTGTLPQRPWAPSRLVQGGEDESWAGIPEAWVDRVDALQALRLRCWEDEWPALRAVLEHAQTTKAVLTFYPDASDTDVSFDCYLVSPKIGERLKPEPGETQGTYEVSIEIRTTDGSAIEPEYFTEPA